MLGKMLLAAVIGVPLLFAGSAIASADSHPEIADGDHLVGLVTGEHGQVLEVRTSDGQVDVHWTANTKCAVNGAPADCGAIAPGMRVAAAGSFSGGSDQFQADAIRARERVRDLDRVAGMIRSEAGQTLVAEKRDGGLVDVTWSEDTRCRTRDGAFDCERLEPGNRIVAVGKLDGDTLQAKAIGLYTGDHADLARVRGTVTANHGQVLALETADGNVNVHWDSETVCQTRSGQIDCELIAEGSHVLAVGEELGGPNLKAKRVIVHAPTDARPVQERPVRPSDAALRP